MAATISRVAAIFIVLTARATFDASAAEPGVTENSIIFGQSGCFSGSCGYAGNQYRGGILTAFHESNSAGGVDGRQLVLLALDDGYDPDRAAANADRFVAGDEVFAVLGGVGTPTTERMVSIFRKSSMPFVGHLTGADFLRDTRRNPNVVNLRAGYSEETRRLVEHFVENLNARRFGIIHQDDSFGRTVINGYEKALRSFDLSILAKAAYSRHSHAVHSTVFDMEKADLDVVLLATTLGPAAEVINTSRSLGNDYSFGLLSFVDTKRLEASLDFSNERIFLTRVIPDFASDSNALVRRFRLALDAYRNTAPETAEGVVNLFSLEGYIVGRFIVEVLKRMPDEMSREVFLSTALSRDPIQIDDWVVSFDEGSNVGSDYVRIVDLSGYNSEREAAE